MFKRKDKKKKREPIFCLDSIKLIIVGRTPKGDHIERSIIRNRDDVFADGDTLDYEYKLVIRKPNGI